MATGDSASAKMSHNDEAPLLATASGTAGLATIADLPTELLLQILNGQDPGTLFHISSTCRRLHHLSLPLLFDKFCKDAHRGQICLRRLPPSILPALHGALFINSIRFINITFDRAPCRLYKDLNILKKIISLKGRATLHTLQLNLAAVGIAERAVINPQPAFVLDELTAALQAVIDVSLQCGCGTVDIHAGYNFQSLYTAKVVEPRPLELPRSRQKRLLAIPFRTFARVRKYLAKLQLRSTRNAANLPDTTKPDLSKLCLSPKLDDIQSDDFSLSADAMHANAVISQKPVSHVDNTTFQCLRIHTELLFEPTWLEWTLGVLNDTRLTELTIMATSFSTDIWSDVFPKIHLKRLEIFVFTSEKLHLVDVTLFLQRHSLTMRKLQLDIPIPLTADLHSDAPVPVPLPTLGLDFPLLQELRLTPRCTPWFVSEVLSSSPGSQMEKRAPALPLLSHFESIPMRDFCRNSTLYAEVDRTLESLASLTKSVAPVADMRRRSCGDTPPETWFSKLTLHCWISTGMEAWIESHVKKSASSPLTTLTHIQTLHLHVPWGKNLPHATFQLLPQFLALFPGLKTFGLTYIQIDQLMSFDAEFWEEARRRCPMLEQCTFNWNLNMTTEDLVSQNWPEQLPRATLQ